MSESCSNWPVFRCSCHQHSPSGTRPSPATGCSPRPPSTACTQRRLPNARRGLLPRRATGAESGEKRPCQHPGKQRFLPPQRRPSEPRSSGFYMPIIGGSIVAAPADTRRSRGTRHSCWPRLSRRTPAPPRIGPALSGGNNRATDLYLNACPYLVTLFFRNRPRVLDSIEATTILTQRDSQETRTGDHGHICLRRDIFRILCNAIAFNAPIKD